VNGARLSHVVGTTVLAAPLRPALRRYLTGRSTILYFHGLRNPRLPELGGPDLESFARGLQLLKDVFHLVSLSELLEANRSPVHPAEPLAAVTFDDGLDLFRNGLAGLLARMSVPATSFVTLASVGNERLLWQHKLVLIAETVGAGLPQLSTRVPDPPRRPPSTLADLMRWAAKWPSVERDRRVRGLWTAAGMPGEETFLSHQPYVTWTELESWVEAGHGIGLHTRSHPFCSTLDAAGAASEIVEPALELAKRFDLASVPCSYPFGDRLPRALEAGVARDAHLSCLLGIRGPSARGTDPLRLERVGGDHTFEDGVFGRPLLRRLGAAMRAQR
jgi:peptidoglycan/xylan/chitin deacetylase (PgdA/CDA1 family)